MKKLFITLAIVFVSYNQIQKAFKNTKEVHTEQKVQIKIKIENITGTVYHLEPKQCDNNPYETADGTIIKKRGEEINKLRYVALSRDLIKDEFRNKLHKAKGQWNGQIQFGDTIRVVSDNKMLCGLWVVKDTMNKRYKNRVDFMQDKNSGFYGKFEDLTIELI